MERVLVILDTPDAVAAFDRRCACNVVTKRNDQDHARELRAEPMAGTDLKYLAWSSVRKVSTHSPPSPPCRSAVTGQIALPRLQEPYSYRKDTALEPTTN